jgi:hypothetical protein
MDHRTWPRNKHIAQAYYDLAFDNPKDERADFWLMQYQYHWDLYMDGEDQYVPF